MKVALQSTPFNRVDLFEAAGFEVVEGVCRSEDDLIELLKDSDGAQVGVMPLTSRKVLEACPKLKVVSRMGVGVDSIDLDAATELGVLACNVPGVNTAEVADHAAAMLLALTRRIYDTVRTTRAGGWRDDRKLTVEYMRTVRRIAGHTVGVIGFGNIGRAFAMRMRGFGPARIIAHDPYVPQTTADLYGVQLVSLEELLKESDYISIHTSLTEETRYIINEDTLKLMKPTALLVNTSRGPVVNGSALASALQAGTIEAAALDVTEAEPVDSQDPLLSLPNAIVTPHLAGFSPTFLEECPIRQAQNIIRALTGEAPWGLANPEVIKTIAVMRSTDAGRWEGVPDFSTALAV
ncbi:MAG: hydroxyacid dehydrogenase [OM182 bacterium MED-G24]|uniref:Hydroxyacid dehydrogenase n=1 Tax=OM182 bacterium MED-G24 TaxID=1986255 RepID=A0A2A5WH58_9GAMM|nr:MAG: hydroxyacid dehydrogenase [OM182 bacterium MED-G24]